MPPQAVIPPLWIRRLFSNRPGQNQSRLSLRESTSFRGAKGDYGFVSGSKRRRSEFPRLASWVTHAVRFRALRARGARSGSSGRNSCHCGSYRKERKGSVFRAPLVQWSRGKAALARELRCTLRAIVPTRFGPWAGRGRAPSCGTMILRALTFHVRRFSRFTRC
jgi:hypothetical protein